ncbi:DNA polymerase III subunit beta [Candidatus Saccharibacteria bacterium]|nr:DNA polymerase III subunit beta [Candidatus Saccharibacteria bacterium]
MELTVTQENLSKALSTIGRVANGRSQLPILNNILLQTDGMQLLVAATNLEIAATMHIGAKMSSPGQITVPARLITEFVSSLPAGPVNLKVEGTHLHVKSGKFSSTIHGMDATEFPELPDIEEDYAIRYELNPADFKRALSQTIMAASSDAARPVLTGVYWHSHNGHLYLAATDGYRLSQRRLVATESTVSAIVPASSLQEVARNLHDDMDKIEVLFDENQARFRADGIEITSRLIDGNFPDYQQLIPDAELSKVTAVLDKAEFSRIVKVAGLFARDSGGSVTVNVSDVSQSVKVHSVASELGENDSEAAAEVAGEGQVTLNSRFIGDALSVLEGSRSMFRFSGKLSPCVLHDNVDQPDFIHIIMPLKS